MQEVQTPFDPFLQNGRHFTDDPIAGPVGRSAQAGAFGADAEGEDFRRVEPGDGAPGGAEGGVVDHDEDDGEGRGGGDVDEDEVGDSREGDDHGDGAREEDRAAAPFVDEVPGGDGGEEIGEAVDAGHEDGLAAVPSGGFENEGGVVGDYVYAV